MNNEFTREERYIVFKLSDVEKYLTAADRTYLAMMKNEIDAGRDCANKPPFKGLIVESDWPEYEPTWWAIEARVTGAQAQSTPSVPDGWPTEEMTTAFARVFNVRDQYGTFPQAFRAALAVAPEAKGEFKKRFASPPRSMIEDSVKEAGISDVPFDFQIVSLEDLERFAAIISKHERDACYEIAQSELRNMSALMSNPPKSGAAWEIARRIQARNNP